MRSRPPDEGARAPLLPGGDRPDVELPPETVVRCRGVEASLQIDDDGSVLYVPLQRRWSARGWTACCSCQQQHLKQQIPGSRVVGAALESPTSLSVWFFEPCGRRSSGGSPGGTQAAAAPRLRLRKTLPFVCASGSEATALVQRQRAAAAWWGRKQAPHVLALINPRSGSGRSKRLWQRHVLPVLEGAAGMTVTALETQHRGHATELLAQHSLAGVDLVVFVGGDGTVFEGVQGLLGRPDWDSARLLPIAHVPGGSGNGLAHSSGLVDAPTAAFAICKASASPLDVASVLQPPGRRLYSLLMATFGLMSNLDVGTERLRFIGGARFTLGCLWEILKSRSYHAGIAWLPPDAEAAERGGDGGAETAAAPAPAGAGPGLPGGLALPVSVGISSQGGVGAGEAQAAEPTGTVSLQDFPPGPDLPMLKQLGALPLRVPQPEAAAAGALPPGWRVMHEPLQMWSLINPPCIAESYRANPDGRLHSGHYNMFWVRGLRGLRGRLAALEVQTKSRDGQHVGLACVTQQEVRALIFEPRDDQTCLMLDGEVVPSVTTFVEVHQGLLRVVVNPLGGSGSGGATTAAAGERLTPAAQQ